jgi:uncharacterized protein (DUF58 family)
MQKKSLSLTNLTEIREFGHIEFLAKQLVEGFITGLHRSPFHGFSVEFAEHRLYNTGESTRHIDWKVFAKTDRLYTKRYEEETNLRCQILLDVSSSMYYPRENYGKITFSILAAGAIAYMLQKQKDAVSLCTFAENIEHHTPTKSTPSHIHKIFLALENLMKETEKQSTRQTSIAETMHQIADKIHRRSLVIIFSDMFENQQNMEAIFSALQHLKHNQHEVLLFHVNDKKTEQDFQFDERPTEFIDLETGQKVKLQPSQIRSFYQKQQQDFYKNLKLRCGQYRIDFIEADIQQGFEQILHAYLVKRAKMR